MDAVTNSQGDGSSQNENEEDYGEEEGEQEIEFTKVKRENVFTQIDYTKRKAKIVGTLGPETREIKDLVRLIDAGMSSVRLNLSHGTLKSNLKLVDRFKQAKRLRPHKTISVMLEARGREIRLSNVNDPSGVIEIRGGQVFTLNCLNPAGISDSKTLYCNSDTIHRYIKPNDIVYFDDGKMVAVVLEILNEGAVMEVKVGGPLKSNSQVRFIGGTHNNLNLLNKRDITDL